MIVSKKQLTKILLMSIILLIKNIIRLNFLEFLQKQNLMIHAFNIIKCQYIHNHFKSIYYSLLKTIIIYLIIS